MHKPQYNDGRNFDTEKNIKWLRPKAASVYFNIGRGQLDKLATACNAKKKIGARTVLYEVEKIDTYLKSI
jgi:hypothetical protein